MKKHPSINILMGCTLILVAGCQNFLSLSQLGGKFISADVTETSTNWYSDLLLSAESTANQTDTAGSLLREIEEADIVKSVDQYLFLLSSARGLRIIDVTDWAAPVLKGSFSFTAAPVEMYVTNNVATIITRNNSACRLDSQAQPVKQSGSKVFLVDVENVDAPSLINAFDIEGFATESRRVGQVIYVAGVDMPLWYSSDTWSMVTSRGNPALEKVFNHDETLVQSPNGFVASIYVADPKNVHLVQQESFAGKGQYIHATQTAIFIAGYSWDDAKTTIQYVDISDPDGKIVLRGSCQMAGQILNRFSMDAWQDVLRVVTGNSTGWSQNTERGVNLYTFDLTNPDHITQKARLPIIDNETLRAVRFDENKAYVVTFLQTDPLWVIDLTDASKPKITGQLEAPGYSTYLHGDGTSLIAVGINDAADWRASVMLYDVSDAENPTELDRAVLGQEYSSSQANYDDKAFNVIPSVQLILVPYDTWVDGTEKNMLQLLDYSTGKLVKLASVQHHGTVERSGVDATTNFLWVMSQSTLQTLNIQNPKSPKSLASVSLTQNVLAWKVVGQYGLRLVQLNDNSVELQVLPADDPNASQVLTSKQFNIYGMYTAQLLYINNSLAVITGTDDSGYAKIATIQLGSLPHLTVAAEKTFDFQASAYHYGYYGAKYVDSLWSYYVCPSVWSGNPSNPLMLDNGGLVYYGYSGSGRNLKIVSLADPADPKMTAKVDLAENDNYTFLSQVGVDGNTLWCTGVKPVAYNLWDAFQGKSPEARYYVQLVDCSDLAKPHADKPVNIPGLAVGKRDKIVFTIDPQWSNDDVSNSFCSVRIIDDNVDLLKRVDLPTGTPGTVYFSANTAVLTLGASYGDGPILYAAKSDECNLGSFNIISIDISDSSNPILVTNSQYAGYGIIAGIAENYVVAQNTATTQAMIWKISDDQSLIFDQLVDLGSVIRSVSQTSTRIDLVCGTAGVISVTPNQ